MNLALHNYNALWQQAAPLYGYGKKAIPPPALTAVPKGGGAAFVTYNPNGTPVWAVNLNPSDRRQLKRKPAVMDFTLLHEWAHIAGAGSEGHANRVANLVTRVLRGKTPPGLARRRIHRTLGIPDGPSVS